MEVYITKPIKFDVKTIAVKAAVRYPEDATFIDEKVDDQNRPYDNYISDDGENPKIPFIEVEKDNYGHKRFYWQPTIDIENGIILNWPKGVKAHIFYKVCDEFECTAYDENNKIMTGEICLDGNFSKREYFLMRAFLLPAAF